MGGGAGALESKVQARNCEQEKKGQVRAGLTCRGRKSVPSSTGDGVIWKGSCRDSVVSPCGGWNWRNDNQLGIFSSLDGIMRAQKMGLGDREERESWII